VVQDKKVEQTSLKMIADGKVDGDKSTPESSNTVTTAATASARLEDALHLREQDRKAEKNEVKKKDGDGGIHGEETTQTTEKENEDGNQQKGMKRPAAASSQLSAKPKAASREPKKRPASASSSKAAPKKTEKANSKGPITRQMRLKKPQGCSKCRFVPGCCDSCWRQRGYRVV
jgi:hypothetical protein